MFAFLYNLHIFAWILYCCLANTFFALEPSSSIIKRFLGELGGGGGEEEEDGFMAISNHVCMDHTRFLKTMPLLIIQHAKMTTLN